MRFAVFAGRLKNSTVVTGHRSKNCHQTVTSTKNKKACYFFSSRLFNAYKGNLVGRAGVEPTTNGLKVRCSTN